MKKEKSPKKPGGQGRCYLDQLPLLSKADRRAVAQFGPLIPVYSLDGALAKDQIQCALMCTWSVYLSLYQRIGLARPTSEP